MLKRGRHERPSWRNDPEVKPLSMALAAGAVASLVATYLIVGPDQTEPDPPRVTSTPIITVTTSTLPPTTMTTAPETTTTSSATGSLPHTE